MTITITLPPETEERLRAQSDATGKKIDTLVIEAVEARLALSGLSIREILSPVHADFRQSGMADEALDALLLDSRDEVRKGRSAGSNQPE